MSDAARSPARLPTRGQALVAVLACAALASSPRPAKPVGGPLAGAWKLNLTQTRYGGGADPRRNETFACAPDGDGVRCIIRSVRSDGRRLVGRFSAAYDGSPAPVNGIPGIDRVRLHRIGELVADATFSYGARPVYAYRAMRSASGDRLTIISVDPATRAPLRSVVVYDRVRYPRG